MRRRTVRSAVSALAVVATAALLAGCFSVEAAFVIKDDATVDLDFVTLIDTKQLNQFAGLLGEDADELDGLSGEALLEELTGGEDPCGDITGELAEYEVTAREIDKDGQVGVGCKVSGIPVAELSSLGDDSSSLTIEQDASGTRFNAVLEDVDQLAGDPDEAEDMSSMLGMSLDDLFSVKFTVTAPGSLGANNASSTSGSTATWDIKPDSDFVSGGDATLTAEWKPGGGSSSSSTLWIILGIVAIVALAILAAVLIKRSKGKSDTPTPDPLAPGAAPVAPAAAPPVMPTPGAPIAPPPPASPPTPPSTTTPPTPPSSTPPPPPPPAS